jgi:putative NADPH-quinone reductase
MPGMGKSILVINGHPDPDPGHLCAALAGAYGRGATTGGHEVRRIDIGTLDFPALHSKAEFDAGPLPEALVQAQEDLAWAQHVVIVYPLWLGTMPARLKAFFEQVLRPGFAFEFSDDGKSWTPRLKGRSARVVVTMGMPAFAYRWFFRAHSLKSLERNILKFVGIRPVRESLFGLVEAADEDRRTAWLWRMERLGHAGR